jgi:hypothetical protein
MSDPRLFGVVERLTHALEEHVKLLREGLELPREIAGERTETPKNPEAGAASGSWG